MRRPPILIAASCLFLCLFLPLAASAKPTPPANLMKIFALFIEGEEYVEESDWGKLQTWLTTIDKQHQQVHPELVKALPADERAELDQLEESMVELRAVIASKQQDPTHDQFLKVHKAFIALLDDFDYKMPPLMFLIANDINELLEAVEENEIDEANNEMIEVETFYGQAVPALRTRKLPEKMISDFQAQLMNCNAALTANKLEKFETEVKKLQHLFAAQSRVLSGS